MYKISIWLKHQVHELRGKNVILNTGQAKFLEKKTWLSPCPSTFRTWSQVVDQSPNNDLDIWKYISKCFFRFLMIFVSVRGLCSWNRSFLLSPTVQSCLFLILKHICNYHHNARTTLKAIFKTFAENICKNILKVAFRVVLVLWWIITNVF